MFNYSLAYQNIKTGEYLNYTEYGKIHDDILLSDYRNNYKDKMEYFPEYYNSIGDTLSLPKELNNYRKTF